MADITNPFGDTNNLSVDLLPDYYKTDPNKRFLQATVDQLIQPGVVKKVNGFIGRENSKATTGSDIFLPAASPDRKHYQLEPGFIVNDQLGNNKFFKDYIDYTNQLSVFESNTTNRSRIDKQEFYSWDPHIDWDKFVNFQNYYWLPYGPETIKIYGQQLSAVSTYTIDLQTEGSNYQIVFTPDGLTPNPTIKLYRGQTYIFNVNSPGNPITIKLKRSLNILDQYTNGVVSQGIETGTITFKVPVDAPDILYYQSSRDLTIGGVFEILSIKDDSYINVESEILGKVNYTLSDGTLLSNGMRVSFGGTVTPTSYATGEYYVEGVGTAITLINANILEVTSNYNVTQTVLFDAVPFDSGGFSDSSAFSQLKDYITINRASTDHNPWSRYNRWIHKDVIAVSAKLNGHAPNTDQTQRAVRPIIEFQANLRLFNFGTTAVSDIDLIDNFTKDVFSTIEGSRGYSIDGVALSEGQKILFVNDTDKFVKNNVYQVTFVDVLHLNTGSRQIHLVEIGQPSLDQVVLVKQGTENQGLMYWYNGTTWIKTQSKTKINQPPLFDVVDSAGISFGNLSHYDGSTFTGTKLFSYKISSSGTNDVYLNFPLTYKNISNIGDIVFEFNLISDTFKYKNVTTVISVVTNVGFLSYKNYAGITEYLNGWQICTSNTVQAAVRIYKNSNQTNNFDLDIFDNITLLTDLQLKIYINGIFVSANFYTVVTGIFYKQIVLATPMALTDVLTIKAYTRQVANSNGFYEIPLNLQNNPLNTDIVDFTLGEVIDHVDSIVSNVPSSLIDQDDDSDLQAPEVTVGNQTYDPDYVNIRDIGNVTQYGTKFVQHSGPASLSVYHITSQTNNIVKAIQQSRDDYVKFKKLFALTASSISNNKIAREQVDEILKIINADKVNSQAYYFTDMAPYGSSVETTINVIDYRIQDYPLNNIFNLDSLSAQAVGVYVNDVQLVYGRDYTFNSQGFITIISSLNNGDVISIFEYDTTDGCFIPETPTKLGIYPKFIPQIYLDTTLVNPQTLIQGHDGSLILAYGDYRDDIILELEKRIYNNIKVAYDTSLYDIVDIIPSYSTDNDYSIDEYNNVLAPSFYTWITLIDQDFTQNLSYNANNPLTYNYKGYYSLSGTNIPGFWRGIYTYFFGTDRPNLCPWEMLGFSVMPTWWTNTYGPAPYTSDNLVMWTDISQGLIKGDGTVPPTINKKYVRPYVINHIPVDPDGNIISPSNSGLAIGTFTNLTQNPFVFGDMGPVETAWRRSSHYPFSVILASLLLKPSQTFGVLLDRSRIIRNNANQIIYKPTGVRITPKDIILPSLNTSATRIQTSGIINYIINYILNDNLKSYTSYVYDLANIQSQITYRLGAFTSKEKFNLILDSKSPQSTGSVFVPTEDYTIILNTSSPVKKISYSGVVITKLNSGYEIRGYNRTHPYFTYYPYTQSGPTVNIGGMSEPFTSWVSQEFYITGKIVLYLKTYYQVKTTHTSGETFASEFFTALGSLPIVGGQSAIFRKEWDKTSPITIPYGTEFFTIQDVVDFLLSYGEYLKDQGFIFDEFNSNLNAVTNWQTSAKEFLFWTTQNWSTGQDTWKDWIPNESFVINDIVKYNGNYFKAIRNVLPGTLFQTTSFVLLTGLSSVGGAVISLSPSAEKIIFKTDLSVVDDIRNQFNGYEIYKVDGTPLEAIFINSYRKDNAVTYSPRTSDGIYGATFYLIQHEHVAILNNTTMFNDTIYNPPTGYKQDRIKVSGYISTNWYGGFDIPGFILDIAKISQWTEWTDYDLGDTVKQKEFYYTASKFLPGSASFVSGDWIKLDSKPVTALLPNWTYKAGQFTDFYSLDSDNFDQGQQKVAQHLIGYQKRQYLENIIQDDVSEYKFYQGMIKEKGTRNVLNKLFDVLSADNQESLTFYEEWALRVGQYGASHAFEQIEFVLNQTQFLANPQGFELVNSIPYSQTTDFIIRQTPNDVYLKPLGYNSLPWPALAKNKPFLNSAGYVRSSEVFKNLKSLGDLIGIDPSTNSLYDVTTFTSGCYVQTSFDADSWNVYQFTNLNIKITAVTYVNSVITFTTLNLVPLTVGQYIGVTQVSSIQGFYQITSIDLNSFTVSATIPGFPSPFTQSNQLVIYGFISQRISTIDNLDKVISSNLIEGQQIWVDDSDGNGNWATYKYNSVYSQDVIANTSPTSQLNFGKTITINKTGNIAVTAMNTGEIRTWDKAGAHGTWIERQTIAVPPALQDANTYKNLSTVIAISDDGMWLAVGSPLAGNLFSRFTGYKSNYAIGDIIIGQIINHTPIYYQAIIANTDSLNGITVPNISKWKKLPYLAIDVTGLSSGLTEQGVVSLYQKDSNNIYTLVDHIISPSPVAYEHFGSNIVFGNNIMYVTASGYADSSGTGIIRQFTYNTVVNAQTPYNPVGSAGTILALTSTAGIRPLMQLSGIGFTNQYVVEVLSATTVQLSVAPTSDPAGIIQFTSTYWFSDSTNVLVGPLNNLSYGTNLSISADNTKLVTLVKLSNGVGSVYVYAGVIELSLVQTITGVDQYFGISISLASTGNYLAIGDIVTSVDKINQGNVDIYKFNLSLTKFEFYQNLKNHHPQSSGYFGTKVSFMNGENTLVVYSADEDTSQNTPIDTNSTTFDKNSTTFTTAHLLSGRIDVYDNYYSKWVYAETLQTSSQASDGFGLGFAVGSNHILVGAPYSLDSGIDSGKIYNYYKLLNTVSWNIIHHEIAKPDVSKIKKAFLYNKLTGTLIKYLDVIDITQGKIAGLANEEIKFKTFYDPAIYTDSTGAVNSVVVDSRQAWNSSRVGMLWWNLNTAKFVDSYDDSVVYRNSNWNTLAYGASIDIYEWVSYTGTPQAWDALADTTAGLAANISGKSLYGNDAYSRTSRYDTISQTTKYTYYFWVKNKTITPNVVGRNLSAANVATLIANPRGYNYSYLTLTGINSFSLVNVTNDLSDSNVVLSVEYWTIDNLSQNIHNQYKLISNDPITVLPADIETKWIDSLCGADIVGRQVPDPALQAKLQYGIENRPRQSMFINRFEALKEYIDQANIILASNQITENRNISQLKTYDTPPSTITGLYDVVKTTEIEISLINTGGFRKPILDTPTIVDGKIVGLPIIFAGSGYLFAPYITITGSGINAKVRAVINTAGQITGVTILNSGQGYTASTTASVRDFSVLVETDSQANGFWAIYSFDLTTSTWTRSRTQSYDVRNYWSYSDWYATGFNQFAAIDYSVDNYYGLNTISTNIGQIVKIRNTNSGGWSLLEKYANSSSLDWTQSYQVVGLQNGTIQLLKSLYQNADTVIGFDGSIYDDVVYDNSPTIELRIILETLKNNIFIDDLKQNYLNLFFTTVRYALSEQLYLDWIFKTSFIKSTHNVGELDQPVTYRSDNLSNFQDYISEVIPYKTTVREYITAFSSVDPASTAVSDFDIPPIYEGSQTIVNTNIVNGKIQAYDDAINQAPWKNWLSNVGFPVIDIKIVNGGSGYISNPVVTITSDSGKDAVATAYIASGQVNRIILNNTNQSGEAGTNYLSAPTVTISGGLAVGGTPATAVAIIGRGVVRSNSIKIKFDRTTYSYYTIQLAVTQTFTGNSGIIQFKLTYAPDIKIGSSSVTVNGVSILRDLYTLTIVSSKVNGYTQYSGLITFVTAPATGSTIIVNYNKDESLLNATDRIQYYYNSGTDLLGSSFAQLMTGTDYGGVNVQGLGFDVATGWGTLPYYSDKWDSVDPSFTDYIVTVTANTHIFTLPYTPAAGVELNFYYIQKDVSIGISDGVNLIYPFSLYDDFIVASAEYDATTVTIQSNYVFPGGVYVPSTTLKVASTVGILPGMTVFGTGFTVDAVSYKPLQTVVSVTNSTTLVLSSAPNTQPNGTLSFTYNVPGSYILHVENADGILINDFVQTSASSSFPAQTFVTAVDYVKKLITLNQIIYVTVPANSTVTFGRSINVVFYNYTVILPSPAAIDTRILITGTLPPVRLDDPNFGTDLNTNASAIMVTPVADGITSIYSIPNTQTINTGDRIIIRQSTSDGSIKPLEQDYDTALSGGDMAYITATGISPEDIIVDGDDLISPTTSPAPEEVVPGQIVDALAIKVYDQPNSGSANIRADKYIADGVIKSFPISQIINSTRAVVVKNNNLIVNYSTDYTVDYKNKLINFNIAPVLGNIVTIFSFGFNGNNIVDIDSFVGDGSTTEFLTKAPWLTHETSLVYVNGVASTVELFKTDATYEAANRTGIRFGVPPAIDAVINYVIVSGSQQTFSVTNTQTLVADGTSKIYSLSYPVGVKLPAESNMIVRVDQTILNSPINQYYTISNNVLNYTVDKDRAVPYSITIDKILIYVDGVRLNLGTDYTIDLGGITVNLTQSNVIIYSGKILTISITQFNGYAYLPDTQQIMFNNVYTSLNHIEIINFYNHDILDVERTAFNITTSIEYTQDSIAYFTYTALASGMLPLDRTVLNDQYVWVTKNNILLTPSVDYKLSDSRNTVILAITPSLNDIYSLMTFNSNIVVPGISYMQFKDMLNRVSFKRLNKHKQTRLATDLHYNDIAIQVIDASMFDVPNPALKRPGIIEIFGERIEFFQITGNTLTQLRRGTLGTGIPRVHPIGTHVQDIGPSETIPYSESSSVITVVSDGTNIVNLPFVPVLSNSDHWFTDFGFTFKGSYNGASGYTINDIVIYNNSYYVNIKTYVFDVNTPILPTNKTYWQMYNTTVPVGYGQCDQIEVFIAGYEDAVNWTTNINYSVGTIVVVASYTYRCISSHTSSDNFLSDSAHWKFFVGNLRLKKQPYKIHNETKAPYSPAGDVQFDADFAVDGTSASLRLTNLIPLGTNIRIVVRKGTNWDSSLNIQYDTNAIANFLKSAPGIWYSDKIAVTQTNTAFTDSFDNSSIGFDDSTDTW